jgi:hypothetical protein
MRSIVLDTPRHLYENSHRLAVHCPDCGVWRDLALSDFADLGAADRLLVGLRFRCQRCGGRGEPQVRAPAPVIDRPYRGVYPFSAP